MEDNKEKPNNSFAIKTGKSLTMEELEEINKDYKKEKTFSSLTSLPNDLVNVDIDPNDTPEEKKKKNRFYLPTLNMNSKELWPSQPSEKRKMFTDAVALETCTQKCCGVDGLASACCKLDTENLTHILGPVPEDWIEFMINHMRKKGFSWSRSDLVIDEEEGRLIGEKFFNGHEIFKQKTSYPMLRIQANGHFFSCKFLNSHNGKCSIYTLRPDFCQKYLCSYIKSSFLITTKEHPHKYFKEY